MEKKAIEQEFNCLGYFGFGNGVSISRSMTVMDQVGFKEPHGKAGYCNSCPLAEACWAKHRAKVIGLFPDLAAYIDKVAAIPDKIEYMEYITQNGVDPYLSISMGNLQDGAFVVATGKPADRGELTLPYPFKS